MNRVTSRFTKFELITSFPATQEARRATNREENPRENIVGHDRSFRLQAYEFLCHVPLAAPRWRMELRMRTVCRSVHDISAAWTDAILFVAMALSKAIARYRDRDIDRDRYRSRSHDHDDHVHARNWCGPGTRNRFNHVSNAHAFRPLALAQALFLRPWPALVLSLRWTILLALLRSFFCPSWQRFSYRLFVMDRQ